jgi:hypothetical protein
MSGNSEDQNRARDAAGPTCSKKLPKSSWKGSIDLASAAGDMAVSAGTKACEVGSSALECVGDAASVAGEVAVQVGGAVVEGAGHVAGAILEGIAGGLG